MSVVSSSRRWRAGSLFVCQPWPPAKNLKSAAARHPLLPRISALGAAQTCRILRERWRPTLAACKDTSSSTPIQAEKKGAPQDVHGLRQRVVKHSDRFLSGRTEKHQTLPHIRTAAETKASAATSSHRQPRYKNTKRGLSAGRRAKRRRRGRASVQETRETHR